MWLRSDHHEWLEADEACAGAFAAARDPRAEWICGGFLSVTGRVRAGLPYREAARRADPLSMNVAVTLARQYAFLDMGEELTREYDRIQGLNGDHWLAEEAMLAYLMHRGAPRAEIADRLERACAALAAGAPPPTYCVVGTNAIRSPEHAAQSLRELLASMRVTSPGDAESVALWASYLGERDVALESLEVLSTVKSTSVLQHMWYPVLGDARKDPRFKEIVRKIGFVDLWRKTGRWADFCRPRGDDDFECF
jgi:hypothetical protein